MLSSENELGHCQSVQTLGNGARTISRDKAQSERTILITVLGRSGLSYVE